MEGGDFTGEEAFLFAVPDNFAVVLVEVTSSCCFSVSAILVGSAIFSVCSVLGFLGEIGSSWLPLSASSWLSRKISGGFRLEVVLLSSESRSISGTSVLSIFGSV